MPRKPYRSPRDWLGDTPLRLFGWTLSENLAWLTPQEGLEEALLAAAKQQNDLACVVHWSMKRDWGTSEVAAFADLHADTVRDVLNGSKHMSLAVLYALTAAVGRVPSVTAAKPKPDAQPHGPQRASKSADR